jgi:hypothetical protein
MTASICRFSRSGQFWGFSNFTTAAHSPFLQFVSKHSRDYTPQAEPVQILGHVGAVLAGNKPWKMYVPSPCYVVVKNQIVFSMTAYFQDYEQKIFQAVGFNQ